MMRPNRAAHILLWIVLTTVLGIPVLAQAPTGAAVASASIDGSVFKLEWSPSGQYIAVATSSGLYVLDAGLNVLVHQHLGCCADVFGVSWSPDGDRLASTYRNDIEVWRWDAPTLTLEHTLSGAHPQSAVFWSPAGDRIATHENELPDFLFTGGSSGRIHFWSTSTWASEGYSADRFFVGAIDLNNLMDWHPLGLPLLMFGGTRIGVTPQDDVEATFLIDATTGQLAATLPPIVDFPHFLGGVAWHPTGDRYLIHALGLYEYPSGNQVLWERLPPCCEQSAFEWSPDGRYIASYNHVVDMDSNITIGLFSNVSSPAMDWHPTGNLIVSGNSRSGLTITDLTTLPEFNAYPIAAAGDDQSLVDMDDNGSESVTLDGSASYDTDGTITSYEWTLLGGGTLATTATASVTLPTGAHVVRLRVTDNEGSSGSGEIRIDILPPPTVTLNLTVSLSSRPAQGKIFRVLLSQAGIVRQDVLVDTEPDGLLRISGILPGQYDIWVKHPQSLAAAQPLVSLSMPTTDVNMGTLAMGDADDSNHVNIADFSILAAAFGTSSGQPGYDPRADFNDRLEENGFRIGGRIFGAGQSRIGEKT